MTLSSAAVTVGIAAIVAAVAFQDVRDITLRPADATLGEPFSSILSVRELADGRVLISDNSRESRLVVADLRTGRVRMIGRIGAGPGEYQAAGRLFPLSNDSTFFIDAPERSRRWLLMHGDSIVATLAPDVPIFRIVGADISGVDLNGRVLGVRPAGAEKLNLTTSRQRSVAVLAARDGAHGDTIVKLRGADQQVTQIRRNGRPFWIVRILIGSVDEQVRLYPDGWIAVVRQEPYRVEWRKPDGSIVRGPDVPWEAPRSDTREKQASLRRLRRRSGPDAKEPDLPWADRLAPIRFNALLGTPEGQLLVLRAQWSRSEDSRYDVFDRAGQRIGQLALPDSERVIGFGPRSIYVSVRDEDGFHYLRRHPWP